MLTEPLDLAAAAEHFPDLQRGAALLTGSAAHAAASGRAPARGRQHVSRRIKGAVDAS